MFETPKKRKLRLPIILAVVLVVIIGILLYPIEYTVVPEWTVQVFDHNGKPADAWVIQWWQDYSVESVGSGHRADAETDENGYVSFPERKGRAGIAQRILVPVFSIFIPHASAGRSAHIAAYSETVDGRRLEGSVQMYDSGKLPQRLKMHVSGSFSETIEEPRR